MPKFRVTIARGEKSAVFTVEAPDEQAAQQQAESDAMGHPALMSDEERQQKITALEGERASYEGGNTSFANRAGQAITTGINNLGGGIGASVLGAAEAVTDIPAMAGEDTAVGHVGQLMGDFLRKKREQLEESTIGYNKRAFESVLGRPMTAQEETEFREGQYKDADKAEFGADIGMAIAGAGLLKGAKTVKGAVGLGILDGAVSTYLLADSEGTTAEARSADRLGEAKVGAVFGGLGSGILVGVPAGLKNGYAKYIRSQIEKAGGIEKYAADSEIAGGRLSLGAWTGNVDILLAEANAAGNTAQASMAATKEALIRNIASAHGVDLPPTGKLGEGLTDQIMAFTDGLSGAFRKVNNLANAAFRSRLSAAESLWDGPLFRPQGEAFMEPLTRIVKELDAPGMRKVSPDVRAVIDGMARSVDEGVTVQQLNRWQVKLNEVLGNKGEDFFDLPENIGKGTLKEANRLGNAYAAQLKEAFQSAIKTAQPLSKAASKALDEVQRARSIYGRRMNTINRMEHEVLTALGVHGKHAKEVASRLIDADPRQVRAAAAILKRLPGGEEALSQLRGGIIHNAAYQSVSNQAKVAGSRTGEFNLGDFLENYASTAVRAVELGLMSPLERQMGMQSVRVARDIMNAGMRVDAGVVRTHSAISLSNLAINAASRDPGFIARLVGSTIEQGKGADWLFHSPQGLKVLVSLRDATVGTKVMPATQAIANAATIALMDIVGENVWQKGLEDENMESGQ